MPEKSWPLLTAFRWHDSWAGTGSITLMAWRSRDGPAGGKDRSMRFAYADPPYLGCGKLYPEHPDARDWDDPMTHCALITTLCVAYPDGWAMSASSPSLRTILNLC